MTDTVVSSTTTTIKDDGCSVKEVVNGHNVDTHDDDNGGDDDGQKEDVDDDDEEVVVVDNDEEEDEDDVIDDEQVNEFKEQLQSLGNYPDKVMINTLSMIATDYQDSFQSATKLYTVWKQCLLQSRSIHEKMPILYVLDSILKNVPGKLFRNLVERDYKSWLPATYHVLPTVQQQKLIKVHQTWKEFNIFTSLEKWKEVGASFLKNAFDDGGGTEASNNRSVNTATVPVIPRNQKDGSLILAKNLRQEMQNILDDLQQEDGGDELNKISLERMADINPTLWYNIKKAAEDGLKLSSSSTTTTTPPTLLLHHASSNSTMSNTVGGVNGTTTTTTTSTSRSGHTTTTNATTSGALSSVTPSFIVESRTGDTVQRSNEWYHVLVEQQPVPSSSLSSGTITTPHNNNHHHHHLDSLVEEITKSMDRLIQSACCRSSSSSTKETEETTQPTKLYTQREAVHMTNYCATARAISQLLVSSLQKQQQQQQYSTNSNAARGSIPPPTSHARSAIHGTTSHHHHPHTHGASSSSVTYTSNFFHANRIHGVDFTTEGIKDKKSITVSLLYEIGLPYQSTIDGKRFRTEQQLSKHLDYIFQQKQKGLSSLSPTTSSRERGWYRPDPVWTMEMVAETLSPLSDPLSPTTRTENENSTNDANDIEQQRMEQQNPDQLYTVVADESANDTCLICGRRFVMYFDTEGGQYKYQNCVSIVMNHHEIDNDDHDVGLEEVDDEPGGSSPQLIHGTCWIGLGQPTNISYDQTIHVTNPSNES